MALLATNRPTEIVQIPCERKTCDCKSGDAGSIAEADGATQGGKFPF